MYLLFHIRTQAREQKSKDQVGGSLQSVDDTGNVTQDSQADVDE